MELWNAVVQGVLIGGLYAITGLGLMLVFGVLRLVNLAHGELVLLGAYVAYVVCDLTNLDPLLALPAVAVSVGAAGWLLHRVLLSGLGGAGGDAPMVAAFAIALILQAAFSALAGNDPLSLSAPYSDSGVDILGVRVQQVYLVVLVVALVCAGATWFALHRTRWGMAVRASGRDPLVAGVVGVDVRSLHATVFALAAALAAVGGVMVGVATSFNPAAGAAYLVFGFAVVVLGGVGSVGGLLLASMSIGVLQALATETIGGSWRDLVVYVALLAVMALRPQGLLGKRVAV